MKIATEKITVLSPGTGEESEMTTRLEVGSTIDLGGTKYHVTRHTARGLYGHATSGCDEAGCAGDECYLGTLWDDAVEAVATEIEAVATADALVEYAADYLDESATPDLSHLRSLVETRVGRGVPVREAWEDACEQLAERYADEGADVLGRRRAVEGTRTANADGYECGQEDAERALHTAEVARIARGRYVRVDEAEVPRGVRLSTPMREQGQCPQWAYGAIGQRSEGSYGDPYASCTDEHGCTRYYRWERSRAVTP